MFLLAVLITAETEAFHFKQLIIEHTLLNLLWHPNGSLGIPSPRSNAGDYTS